MFHPLGDQIRQRSQASDIRRTHGVRVRLGEHPVQEGREATDADRDQVEQQPANPTVGVVERMYPLELVMQGSQCLRLDLPQRRGPSQPRSEQDLHLGWRRCLPRVPATNGVPAQHPGCLALRGEPRRCRLQRCEQPTMKLEDVSPADPRRLTRRASLGVHPSRRIQMPPALENVSNARLIQTAKGTMHVRRGRPQAAAMLPFQRRDPLPYLRQLGHGFRVHQIEGVAARCRAPVALTDQLSLRGLRAPADPVPPAGDVR